MNHATTSKKAVSLLLILAMLSVLVAAIVPFVSSATEPEIQDFSYQTPNDYDMLDATTSLRFVFTVPEDKVDGYTAAGFVLSKSVAEPEVGAANCLTCPTTKVYSAITADGKTENAPRRALLGRRQVGQHPAVLLRRCALRPRVRYRRGRHPLFRCRGDLGLGRERDRVFHEVGRGDLECYGVFPKRCRLS